MGCPFSGRTWRLSWKVLSHTSRRIASDQAEPPAPAAPAQDNLAKLKHKSLNSRGFSALERQFEARNRAFNRYPKGLFTFLFPGGAVPIVHAPRVYGHRQDKLEYPPAQAMDTPRGGIPHCLQRQACRTCSTASRRPLMIGLPPKILGFAVIRSRSLSLSIMSSHWLPTARAKIHPPDEVTSNFRKDLVKKEVLWFELARLPRLA